MKKLLWLFPCLFLIDNILGLNGYQFTIFGVGIRIILFALSMGVLCLYCLHILIKQQFTLFKRVDDRPCLAAYWKPMDSCVMGFLLLNLVWATVIPLLTGGNLTYAINDVSPILVMALYFPCVFLMRMGEFSFRQLRKWLMPLLLLLALWHTVMYIGEVNAPGFYASYYDLIDIISFGTAVRTDVVYGFGITRVIQVTTIFLIPAMFLILEQFGKDRWYYGILPLALVLFAILITYTKSIWYGVLAGVLVACAGLLIFLKDHKHKKQILCFGLVLLLLFCLFNFAFLHNTVISRAKNSARPTPLEELDQQINDLRNQLSTIPTEDPTDPTQVTTPNKDVEKLQNQLNELTNQHKDAAGTAEANAKRDEQRKALLGKWSQSKWFGFGYGAYAENCIRNDQFPYMYECLIPALMMKFGILGMLVWGLFVLALVFFTWKALWKKPLQFWCWIGTALAFAMAVQTNPFLFTFAGFSLMTYLALYITDPQEES